MVDLGSHPSVEWLVISDTRAQPVSIADIIDPEEIPLKCRPERPAGF